MRELDVPAPHFTDRVEQAQQLVASRDRTPALADADRELLGGTLRDLRRVIGGRRAAEQLLHGEPHPGNVRSPGRRDMRAVTRRAGSVRDDHGFDLYLQDRVRRIALRMVRLES
jgi:hypothetical protein